jgi:BASS family bile acid:Na+ symporter
MEETSPLATVALPLALALIMGSLGLSLTVADFTRIFRRPRGVLIGLGNLFLLSPLLAFAVAEVFGLAAILAVGLVLLGASPGGTTANLMTHLARGDTALSVTMTALSSLAAVVTVPLYLNLAIDRFDADIAGDVSTLGISLRVFLITVVPLAAGMAVRARRPEWTAAHQGRFRTLATVAFVLVVVGAVASEFETISENFLDLAGAALLLNVLAMAGSFATARVARLDLPQATAVALELGVHNGTLAIAVAALIVDELAIPAAVYSAFMYVTAGLFARALHRRNAAAATAPAPTP